VRLHLVDGTYELFRTWFGAPSARAPDGREVGAVRGLLSTLRALLRRSEVTHVACAFDTVVESFRNELFPGYKTGEGLDPDLFGQFPLAERAVHALGVVAWPMIDFEADDVLAAAAARWSGVPAVEQVVICSPDKDLAQCVRGDRVVLWDRRRDCVYDEDGVRAKWGVAPRSIPDWLALVGDSADGLPGVPRWGARSSATLLARYRHIEDIPEDPELWDVAVRGRAALAASLAEHRDAVDLYKRLATLREDVPLAEDLEDLSWAGPREVELRELCAEIGYESFL